MCLRCVRSRSVCSRWSCNRIAIIINCTVNEIIQLATFCHQLSSSACIGPAASPSSLTLIWSAFCVRLVLTRPCVRTRRTVPSGGGAQCPLVRAGCITWGFSTTKKRLRGLADIRGSSSRPARWSLEGAQLPRTTCDGHTRKDPGSDQQDKTQKIPTRRGINV